MITAILSTTSLLELLITCPILVRNYHHPSIISDVQPPMLDPSPKTVDDCGWSTMDWLGVAFILVCCVAALGGIGACICCCSRGRSSNF